jgi:hypothetical protein
MLLQLCSTTYPNIFFCNPILFVICISTFDRLCGLVVRVPGCRSRGPGSIPGATRFSEKWWVWDDPLILVSTTGELLERKSSGSGLEIREYGIRRADHVAPSLHRSWH